MTDVAPIDSSEPAVNPIPPEVQAELDRLRAEKDARIAAVVQAQQAEESRLAALNAAKAVCFAACGPISEAAANATDEEERQALFAFEQRTHAGHAAEIEQAYLVFSGQREGDSNPASGDTPITADVVASNVSQAG